MDYTVKEFKVPSCDGVHQLNAVAYIPSGDARAILHVAHGMVENISRYGAFMAFMAENGYITVGYDHLGHGRTVNDESELGFIGSKRGWELLVKDIKTFHDAVKKEYGELPYYLMGHSMGSFIARLAAARYVRPDKLIIMGTGGPNPAADLGLSLIAVLKKVYGERSYSRLLNRLCFGTYSDTFGQSCQFTVSAMGDLIRLLKYCNLRSWYKELDKNIPILIVSGDGDPVGEYGKGIRKIHKRLEKTGHKSKYILYTDAGHELLNDVPETGVKTDILEFIKD